MKRILFVCCLLVFTFLNAQPNCYIYPEGSGERKACELSQKSQLYTQGSKEKQELFDSIIAIGPNYAWAYYQKSVPYFKRGFLHQGLQILNKAVALDPLEFLCYRAIWYWEYQNLDLCIQDLETYYKLPKAYVQFTPGGDKDMRIILGLAYAKTGQIKKGIQTIENCIYSYESDDYIGYTDYHSLGILYVLDKQYNKATIAFNKQLEIIEDIPDTYYFLGLAYKGLSNTSEAKTQFNKALTKYLDKSKFSNTNAGYRVYESDINKELKLLH